jgi:hypothetical protein
MHFGTPVQAISNVAFVAVCTYALWRGGRTERWAAVFTALAWALTPWIEDRARIAGLQVGVFIIDAAYLCALLALALWSDRYWPMAAAGLQIIEVLMHFAMLIDPKVYARAYFVGVEISSYLVLAVLAVGVWLEAPVRPGWRPAPNRGRSHN